MFGGIRSSLAYVIVGFLVVAILGALLWSILLSSGEQYHTKSVIRTTLIESVRATGSVEVPERVDLTFKSLARLKTLLKDVGDTVEQGEVIGVQDTDALDATLAEAEAAVSISKSKYEKLVLGSSPEDRKVADAALETARIAAENAEKALLETLRDSYTKARDAVYTKGDQLFTNPLISPELSFHIPHTVLEGEVERSRADIGLQFDTWSLLVSKLTPSGNPTAFVDQTESYLESVRTYLGLLSNALSLATPHGSVTEAHIDAWRTSISQSRTSIGSTISAVLLSEKSYEAARSGEEEVNKQKDRVAARAQPVDVQLADAERRQAEAKLRRARAEREEAELRSPVRGTIASVDVTTGDLVGPGVRVATLFPETSFEVELNVSENDIVKVALGQVAYLTLDAFGTEKSWQGSVIRIDPRETLIGGAVYYKAAILFENDDDRVRSGMTAEAVIQTSTKTDTLSIPASALRQKNGTSYVRILRPDGGVEERVVLIGIRDSEGNVEILQGLSENERVVLTNASNE